MKLITGKMTSSSRKRKPYFFVATCKAVLVLIQESKTDNENETIFQIQKNWNSYRCLQEKHWALIFYYCFYYLGKRGLRQTNVLQYIVYLNYKIKNQSQRPNCTPKVDSSISQCVSCAPHAAHMPNPLQLGTEILGYSCSPAFPE